LTPAKLAAIAIVSEELAERSTPDIETVLRQVLSESAASGLDLVLFGDDPGSAAQPAGLFFGVTPLTPATPASPAADIAQLIGALPPGARPVFAAAPVVAAKLGMLLPQALGFPIAITSAMANDQLGAIDANGFISAVSTPRIDISQQTAVHLEDTAPATLIDTGPALAVPTVSTWQQDLIGLRLIAQASWGRRSNAVALVDGIAW
jgi:hypothetical protein